MTDNGGKLLEKIWKESQEAQKTLAANYKRQGLNPPCRKCGLPLIMTHTGVYCRRCDVR